MINNNEMFNEFDEMTKRYEKIHNSYVEMNPLERMFRIITNEDEGYRYARISTELFNEARIIKVFIKNHKLDKLMDEAVALCNALDEDIKNILTGHIMAEKFAKVLNESSGFKDGEMENIVYKAYESSKVLTKTLTELDEVYGTLNEYLEFVNCHAVEEIELKTFYNYIYHLQDCNNKINRFSRDVQKCQCCAVLFIYDFANDFVEEIENNEGMIKAVRELIQEKKQIIKRIV